MEFLQFHFHGKSVFQRKSSNWLWITGISAVFLNWVAIPVMFRSSWPRHGYAVTGVDFSFSAIQKAKKKACLAGVNAEFYVQDATHLGNASGTFETALEIYNSGGMNPIYQKLYTGELARLVEMGGTFLLWCAEYPPFGGVDHLSPAYVKFIFSSGFRMDKIEPSNRNGVKSYWYWFSRE